MPDDDAIDIQPLGPGDHAAWLPLWRAYQTFYGVDIPDDVTATTWRRLLDPAEPMHGALARRVGAVVGLVHFIRHRSCWTTGDDCYLQDLFVEPARRGGGIGRRLIDHVQAAAIAAGCARVYWLTHETNTTAMVLYDKLAERSGFTEYTRPTGA
ncbi:GNAT family N-acetyltransferase [Methylobrevis albus]|uniref:GNAT family N-acetyltransferase n=1 Tax=Methylobrevis albus TaxID=2793297 RepID=A0A931MYP2_9HYPH|nr:GNAT family N-acetyltransferase [Methylobrevis albus]MBH0238195.1 GNAT family N-acetyltransferase [Methylobrevis albus]